MANWQLIARPVVEPNTYHTNDKLCIDRYSRSAYLFIFLVVYLFKDICAELNEIIPASFVIIATLPILWTVGLLPSFRIGLSVTLERINTDIYGSSPLYFPSYTLIIFVVKSIIITISTIISHKIAYLLLIGIGCTFSSSVVLDTISRLWFRPQTFPLYFKSIVNRSGPLLGSLLLAGSLFCMRIYIDSNLDGMALNTVLIVSKIVEIMTCEMQKLYIPTIFPVISNPIRYIDEDGWAVGLLRLLHVLATHFNIPVSFLFVLENTMPIYSRQIQFNFWESAMLMRSFSHVWTFPGNQSLDCSILIIFDQYSIDIMDQFDFGTKLFIISIAVSIFRRLIDKLGFWAISLHYFLVCILF
jgi:hypothetical protein